MVRQILEAEELGDLGCFSILDRAKRVALTFARRRATRRDGRIPGEI